MVWCGDLLAASVGGMHRSCLAWGIRLSMLFATVLHAQVLELALVFAAVSGVLAAVVPAEILCEEQVEVGHFAPAVAAFVGVLVPVVVAVLSTRDHLRN